MKSRNLKKLFICMLGIVSFLTLGFCQKTYALADDSIITSWNIQDLSGNTITNAQLNTSQVYRVTVNITNTGSNTWTVIAPNIYQFYDTQIPIGSCSYWRNNGLSLQTAVPGNGGTTTLVYSITAPPTAMTWVFDYQMKNPSGVFFGQHANQTFTVVSTNQTLGSAAFLQCPTTIGKSKNYDVTVLCTNTGTTRWETNQIILAPVEMYNNSPLWGVTQVTIPQAVATDYDYKTTFVVAAPSNTGTYNMSWKLIDTATSTVLATTNVIPVTVVDDSAYTESATLISSNIPSYMTHGQKYNISMTFRNTGQTTWFTTGKWSYKLASYQDNTTWGIARAIMPNVSVSPGTDVTFTFTVTAPTTTGSIPFYWRVIKECASTLWSDTSRTIYVQ